MRSNLSYAISIEEVGDRLGFSLLIFLVVLAFQITMGDNGVDGNKFFKKPFR